MKYLLHEYLGTDTDNIDAGHVLLLAEELEKRLKDLDMYHLYRDIEHPLIRVLADMEWTGFNVDKDTLKELDIEFTETLEELTNNIYEMAGEEFNINSPKQLGIILFENWDYQ